MQRPVVSESGVMVYVRPDIEAGTIQDQADVPPPQPPPDQADETDEEPDVEDIEVDCQVSSQVQPGRAFYTLGIGFCTILADLKDCLMKKVVV